MIKLRTIVGLAAISGLCVGLVLTTSLVASRRPKSANLHANTRSVLTADYSSDPGPPTAPLSPLKSEIIESAGKDEAQLAKTELRIGPAGGGAGGGSSSNPRLDDFQRAGSGQSVAMATTPSAPAAKPAAASTTSPAATPPARPPQRKPQAASPTPSYVSLGLIPCSVQSLWRSVNSLTETKILFNNKTSQTMKVWELNFSGGQDFKSDVNPNEQVLVETYVSHPWLVTDSGGNCRGIYSPKNQPGIVVID